MSRKYKIMHDKRSKWTALAATLIFLIVSAVSLALTMSIEEIMLRSTSAASVCITCSFIGPILFTFSLLMYLNNVSYLKRLKKYGYTVPVNKKDYDSDLRKLPRDSSAEPETAPSRESIALGAANLAIAVLSALYGYVRISRFDEKFTLPVESGIYAFLILIIAVTLVFFLLRAALLWRQRDRNRFRDDVDTTKNLPARRDWMSGIILTLIFSAACIIFFEIAYATVEALMRHNELVARQNHAPQSSASEVL